MAIWEIILLAFGLAMDAAAVSMTNGMCIRQAGVKHALIMGLSFGLFQGIMPLFGYLAGVMFSALIGCIDHWIALVLLGFIGAKMIYESVTCKGETSCLYALRFRLLLAQSIATSIDALAVGVSLAALHTPILPAAGIIALVTFCCSFFAAMIGRKFGNLLGSKAELVGGILLIAIGLKIFMQHLLTGC